MNFYSLAALKQNEPTQQTPLNYSLILCLSTHIRWQSGGYSMHCFSAQTSVLIFRLLFYWLESSLQKFYTNSILFIWHKTKNTTKAIRKGM